MRKRYRLSRGKSRRVFKRGLRVHKRNRRRYVMRGGYRI